MTLIALYAGLCCTVLLYCLTCKRATSYKYMYMYMMHACMLYTCACYSACVRVLQVRLIRV